MTDSLSRVSTRNGTDPGDKGDVNAAGKNALDMVFIAIEFGFQEGKDGDPTDKEIKDLICKTNLFFRDALRNYTNDNTIQVEATDISWAYNVEGNPIQPVMLNFTVNATKNDYKSIVPWATVWDGVELSTPQIENYLEFYAWETPSGNLFRFANSANFTGEANAPIPPPLTLDSTIEYGFFNGNFDQEPNQQDINHLINQTTLFYRDRFRNCTNDANVQVQATDIDWAYNPEGDLTPLMLTFTSNVTTNNSVDVVPREVVSACLDEGTLTMFMLIADYIQFYIWEGAPEGSSLTEINLANMTIISRYLPTHTCPTTESPIVVPTNSSAPAPSRAPSQMPTLSASPTRTEPPAFAPSTVAPADGLGNMPGASEGTPSRFTFQYDWDELPPKIQEAAGVLGYNQTKWDNKETYLGKRSTLWEDLSLEDQAAAVILGYDEASWNPSTIYTMCKGWNELPPEVQEAAGVFGYDQTKWDSKTDESVIGWWSQLPPKYQAAAAVLGYDAFSWDAESAYFDKESCPNSPTVSSSSPTAAITPMPTFSASHGGPAMRQQIKVKYYVFNKAHIVQPAMVNASGLSAAWPVFSREVVADINAARNRGRILSGRRRLTVSLEPGTASIDEIVLADCPKGSIDGATCHNVTSSYDLSLHGDDPLIVEQEYGQATIDAVDGGRYQEVLGRTDPNSPLTVGIIPKLDSSEPRHGLWALILVPLFALLLASLYLLKRSRNKDDVLEPYCDEGFVYDFLVPPTKKPLTDADDGIDDAETKIVDSSEAGKTHFEEDGQQAEGGGDADDHWQDEGRKMEEDGFQYDDKKEENRPGQD